MSQHDYFLSCPKGLEYLLADEMVSLGMTVTRNAPAGVWGRGDLEAGYRACLWSRLANRVILHLATVDGQSGDALYDAVTAMPWEDHLDVSGRFRVAFVGRNDAIRNSQYGVQRVKDAIVDRLRKPSGIRPAVDTQDPDIGVSVRLHRGEAQIGLDLSGESLHKRGYRTEKGAAPLRENLAAALLLRAGWPEVAAGGGDFTDPMCGSGTLLIEAAMMACDMAPGLQRSQYGFSRWPGHDNRLWQQLVDDARERAQIGQRTQRSKYRGYDQNPKVIATAWRNIQRMGLEDRIHVEKRDVVEFRNESQASRGLILTNPPYGERLSEKKALGPVYEALGQGAREQAQGWRLGVFTGVPELCHGLGLRSYKQYKLFNGQLPAQLLLFEVSPDNEARVRRPGEAETVQPRIANQERADMLRNRLRKNRKQLGSWARKQGIECYRLYDADMPEFALAIDCYGDRVHVQEYAPPKSVDARAARERLGEALAVIPEVLDIEPEALVCKQRQRQAGTAQYEKQSASGDFFSVHEAGCALRVNLRDYLDTGLFLDHRPVRQWIQQQAVGKRFLNLFCYTGAATVHAGVGGASETVSVDMSKTYLNWARENLALNGLEDRHHRLIQADCLQWLQSTPRQGESGFDLIFMDPPTFSNSARMEGVLDVQRDHGLLIRQAMARLAPGGVLVFSNNFRRFRLEAELEAEFDVRDVTARTIDKDFARNPRIHRCWEIREAQNS
ncbi:bifunctional 23S rRNA (guanine(2069)-N(7))-methyltransferase RlmK/23S rRNA (guanine(2445)-N(2))-methyltransferase RlmL [Marinobacter sp. JSM 1782161]|uniref:bifunctional 23S rRNA (guanine(2069)-N(7))-methyltransferase RlmK/23S rRNA (guanine(2445)-N(2))-methyltransferase RlmL n=1 Tax=Marinobacter sp. JSM 1782161 TaxID=2685906 RepID=UPI0014041CC6|nr:bifunctional 23S rRNA (guanine(2069)-N(7))-methyltransferase RlmK/23S rRNA (guanine(2445)-N(2))-methyltransferase RlmL [Marinobacter sp. JSM 1782161]